RAWTAACRRRHRSGRRACWWGNLRFVLAACLAQPSCGRSTSGETVMKITDVLAHALAADYPQPSWTAHERMDRQQLVLVEVRTDQGISGFGEVAGGPQKVICDLV